MKLATIYVLALCILAVPSSAEAQKAGRRTAESEQAAKHRVKIGMTLPEVLKEHGRHYRVAPSPRSGSLYLIYDDISVYLVDVHSPQAGRVQYVNKTDLDTAAFLPNDTPYADAKPESVAARTLPEQPRQPGGFLTNALGVYVTIEGVLYDGNGKVESNSLVVDTVDGRKLDKPILILVSAVRLPAKTRCVLKGYELGNMIGSPPALRQATEERGQRYVEHSAAVWRWRPYFVPLIAVQPEGLEIPVKDGITAVRP